MMLALYGLPHKYVDTNDKIMRSPMIPTMTSNSFALIQYSSKNKHRHISLLLGTFLHLPH